MADAEQISKNVERSTPYPGLSLEDAITATGKLRTSYGATSSYSRDSVAEALGHQMASGPANKKIAALAHFGLITRQGTAYKQSDIADRIFNPLSDDERLAAVREAFAMPALYKKLIEEYDRQAMPSMFDKVLIRKYKIAEKAATKAAKTFITSAEYAEVLNNGILNVGAANVEAATLEKENVESPNPDRGSAKGAKKAANTDVPADMLPIDLKDTGITILFPVKYAYDLSLGAFTTGIKALLQDAGAVSGNSDDDTQVTEE